MNTSGLTLPQVTIGIITALPEEFAAVSIVLPPLQKVVSISGKVYHLCTIQGINGVSIVAVTLLTKMGTNMAAAATADLCNDCENIQDIVMVGIAGAIPQPNQPNDHVRLGDIFVSGERGVYQIDFVKQMVDGVTHNRSCSSRPSARLLSAIKLLQVGEISDYRPWEDYISQGARKVARFQRPHQNTDILHDGDTEIPHPHDPNRRIGYPRVFIGTIASGNTLLKDPVKRTEISHSLPNVICWCVEMEGAGVQDAAWDKGKSYLVIRGTCDYCDEYKTDVWHNYAALVAAAYCRSVIENVAVSPSSRALHVENHQRSYTGFNFIFGSFNRILTELAYGFISTFNRARQECLSQYSCDQNLRINQSEEISPAIESSTHDNRDFKKFISDFYTAWESWNYDHAAQLADNFEPILLSQPSNDVTDDYIRSVSAVVKSLCNRCDDSKLSIESCLDRSTILRSKVTSLPHLDSFMATVEFSSICDYLDKFRHGPDAALELLHMRNDQYAIRFQLLILINQERFTEAFEIIDKIHIHEHWCDLALMVFVFNNRIEDSQNFLRTICSAYSKLKNYQCIIRFSQAMMNVSLKRLSQNQLIYPTDLTQDELKKISLFVDIIQPIVHEIMSNGQPHSGLEVTAINVSWNGNYLLQNHDNTSEMLHHMQQWSPIPEIVARGVINGIIEASDDLPARLRAEHVRSFDIGVLALIIQFSSLRQYSDALIEAQNLIELADSNERKEELFWIVLHLWQHLRDNEMIECEKTARALAFSNPRLCALLDASIAIRNENPASAIKTLDSHSLPDDPIWLQQKANAYMQQAEPEIALEFIYPAAKLTRNIDVLGKAAGIATHCHRYDIAVECYEAILDQSPGNLVIHGIMAHLYANVIHDMEKAWFHFDKLHQAEPENISHTVNLAVCQAQRFMPEESLKLFEIACHCKESPMEAVLGRANLHHSLGDPVTALESLKPFRDMFWHEPAFIMTFLTISTAAGDDEAFRDAFISLNRLSSAGKVKPEAFRAMPQEEGLELFRQSFLESQQRNQQVHEEMLRGKMPWVWAIQSSHMATYMGWRVKTQDVDWIQEEPNELVRLCIYSTNGFHPRETKPGDRTLEPLDSPPPDSAIVADITSLITLHRLELLDQVAEFFGKILVPARYLATVLDDNRKMVLNQFALHETAEIILQLVNEDRITVMEVTNDSQSSIPIVDEYSEDETHHYRLIDLLNPLLHSGAFSDEESVAVQRICSKPSAADDSHPTLTQFQEVTVDLSTMETLSKFKQLDRLVSFFKISISQQAHRSLKQRIREIVHQDETREWHLQLWRKLRADERFQFVPHQIPETMRDKLDDSNDYLPFLGNFVALEHKFPLLADDRVCQVFALHETADVPHAAFGTDVLILQLQQAGKINTEQTASLYLQLMRWRYRFIIPTVDVLKYFADQYRNSPPGCVLHEIAEYLHDCMRDPGLFAGPEQTTRGESMAMRCYMSWISTIAEFVILVWADEGYSPETATKLTHWSILEFCPSVPRSFNGEQKVRIAEITTRLFVSKALIETSKKDKPRYGDAMKAIKDGFLLTDDEYQKIVTEILHDFDSRTRNS